jgi:hypothetical protein
MPEKQHCPTCPKTFKTGARGIEAHIRQIHGDDALKTWKASKGVATVTAPAAHNGNGNGQQLDYVHLPLSNGGVLSIERKHGFKLIREMLDYLERNGAEQ